MSWDIELYHPETGAVAEVQKHAEGGTYPAEGTCLAKNSVTYNYAIHFGFKELNGLTGEQSMPILRDVVRRLGTECSHDYWAARPGNTGYAANILLGWAALYPEYIWEVT